MIENLTSEILQNNHPTNYIYTCIAKEDGRKDFKNMFAYAEKCLCPSSW
jgi:hypothetical protein